MENVGQLIKQISNKLICDLNNNLKKYDITFSQVQVMLVIKENDNFICQKKIATELHINHTSVIDILKILNRKGLISTVNSKENLKLTNISLTSSGLDILKKMDFGKDKTEEMIASTLGFKSTQEMLNKFKLVLI